MAPRDVKRLGCCSHHDETVFNPVDLGHWDVRVTRHNQVVVNLVRYKDEVMALCKGGDGFQLGLRPNAAARVVRRAKNDHSF